MRITSFTSLERDQSERLTSRPQSTSFRYHEGPLDMRMIITAFVVIMIGLAAAGPASAQSPPVRPNIVLIVSDDHGFGDIGWHDPQVSTPNLVRLAQSGTRLDRFYVNPICSVTRAALMTGISTSKTGVNNSSGLGIRYRILPQAFHDAGYQTWMFGKWHLGGNADSQRPGPEFLPHARGFDYFYGHLHGAIDYYLHQRKDLGQLDWQRNGKPIVEEGFSTDLLADDAIRMIRGRDHQRPFLLYLAFNAIHGPLQAPPATDITARGNRRELLLANLSHMDAAIGRVVATLQQQGLRDNTLIWFTGDNGGQLSQGASNGPLRGEKGGAFEGGLRVPALVSWPARFPAGQTSQQFMCAMDVLPTLCAAAAIPTGITGPIDGVDVGESIRTGQAMPRPPFVMGARDVAVFRPPFKLVQSQGAAPMLFQLEEDPTEQHDVASQHPETVAELSKLVILGRGPGGGGGQGKGRRGEGEAGGVLGGMKQGQGGMKQGQGGARQGQGGMKQGQRQGQRQGGGGRRGGAANQPAPNQPPLPASRPDQPQRRRQQSGTDNPPNPSIPQL